MSAQFCAGCPSKVTTDWHNDATLRAVVNKAVEGTTAFVKQTFSDEVGNSPVTLKDVSDIKQQVKLKYYVHF